jgi:hypothetical protein
VLVQVRPDPGAVPQHRDADFGEVPSGPDSAAQQYLWRSEGARAEDDVIGGHGADRAVAQVAGATHHATVDDERVDHGTVDDRQPRIGAEGVEIGERRVDAHAVGGVDRGTTDAQFAVQTVQVVPVRQPRRDAAIDEIPMERLDLVLGVPVQPQCRAGPVEVAAQTRGLPARAPVGRPRVVVARPADRLRAPVVRRAPADHPGPLERERLPAGAHAVISPVVGVEWQRGGVEEVGGPAPRRQRPVVGAGLDQGHPVSRRQ